LGISCTKEKEEDQRERALLFSRIIGKKEGKEERARSSTVIALAKKRERVGETLSYNLFPKGRGVTEKEALKKGALRKKEGGPLCSFSSRRRGRGEVKKRACRRLLEGKEKPKKRN